MTPHRGGCQCGAIRYAISADPIMTYACHCTICQTQSGSAFGLAAVFDAAALRLSGIEPIHFVRAGHGRRFRCHFCPQCGTRLYQKWYTEQGDYPFLSLKPGTLDDASWFRPGCHVWTESTKHWVRFAEADVVFERQPSLEDMPRFAAR